VRFPLNFVPYLVEIFVDLDVKWLAFNTPSAANLCEYDESNTNDVTLW
jgi:hypothetical protein